jgi:hypothetical protein
MMKKRWLAPALLLLASALSAQEATDLPPYLHQLPAPFSRFSSAEVLKAVFPSYDPKTERQAEFPNQERQPAFAGILQAQTWNTGGGRYLVVFAGIAADDQFRIMCSVCLTYGLLAVLREDQGRIVLVARQEAGPFEWAGKDEPDKISGPLDAIWFTGNEEVRLDLAPYKLTRDERLIGVRSETTRPFMHTTNLELYRMTGKTLRKAFEGKVEDWNHPNGQLLIGPVDRTTAILSSKPAGKYYDLVIHRTEILCPEPPDDSILDDEDCTLRLKGTKRIGQQQERWRFDGTKFVQVSGSLPFRKNTRSGSTGSASL